MFCRRYPLIKGQLSITHDIIYSLIVSTRVLYIQLIEWLGINLLAYRFSAFFVLCVCGCPSFTLKSIYRFFF